MSNDELRKLFIRTIASDTFNKAFKMSGSLYTQDERLTKFCEEAAEAIAAIFKYRDKEQSYNFKNENDYKSNLHLYRVEMHEELADCFIVLLDLLANHVIDDPMSTMEFSEIFEDKSRKFLRHLDKKEKRIYETKKER